MQGRPRDYDEPKQKLNLSLTETAVNYLKDQKEELSAKSLSDVIEKQARQQDNNSDNNNTDKSK
jgi:hypothetical protein